MLERIISFSIKQRLVVLIGIAGLITLGTWSYFKLPIEAFPDVLNEMVQVITLVPGQSAEDVEKKVTVPLEREFSGIPRVIQKRSVSEFGLSVIYLYFDDHTDGYWARTQTMEKIATAALPNGVQPSLAPMASVTGEIFRYELKGNGYSPTALRTIQDWTLEKEFRSVPGVADVIGYGGKVRTWDVLIDPLKLATYGLSVKTVTDSIQNANANAGGNMISWPNQSFLVRADGEIRSMSDLGHVGIALQGRSVIRVQDVARIQESNATPRGVVGRDDRDEIVQGIVLLRKGENPVSVGDRIRAKFEELKTGTLLPEGVRLVPYYDRLELVAKTTKTVGKNLLEGLLFVTLVLYLFLRNKYATALVALVVPLSLLFAFCLMIATGTPANLISLGAIDFGIIVDGGVIIVEYVLRKIHESHGQAIALEKTIAEVVRPVTFSMSMIILAYLPIFTLQRVEGKMFTPLAWTISFALLGSLLLALTLVPALLPAVLARDSAHTEPEWINRLRKRYEGWLAWCHDQPRRFFAICGGALLVGLICFKFAGTEFLPELDEGALWIRASFPHSTSIEEGAKLAREVRLLLKAMPETRTVVSQLGGPEDGSDPNLLDNCEFFVDLKPKESWTRFHHEREELIRHIRGELAKFPGIDFNVSQPIADNVEEALSGVKGKNAAKIYGPDAKVLSQIATDLIQMIQSVPGAVDVGKTATIPSVPQVRVRVDRTKVTQAGLTLPDVNDLVETAVGGKVATKVYDGETQFDVVVRASEEYRKSMDDIRNLPLPVPGGSKTQLARVADVSLVNSPQAIYREKGYRRIGVKFNVEGRDLGSVTHEILDRFGKMKIPAGYFVEWDGEYENQKRAMGRLMVVIPLTLFLLSIVLFLLFDDLSIVAAVLATLFLALVGSVLLLFMRGIPFSVSAAVGMLALFGVVSLDDVTLASTYLRLRKADRRAQPWTHAVQACRERFRPLMMTSTLAALGLIPAAISHGIGSETQKPLATAVIGGMCTGLPAVLFFLPMALVTLEKLKARRQRK